MTTPRDPGESCSTISGRQAWSLIVGNNATDAAANYTLEALFDKIEADTLSGSSRTGPHPAVFHCDFFHAVKNRFTQKVAGKRDALYRMPERTVLNIVTMRLSFIKKSVDRQMEFVGLLRDKHFTTAPMLSIRCIHICRSF
jgi:hypothetical protein